MLTAFERALTRSLPAARVVPSTLHTAIRYSALSPGKRMRPLLALSACAAVGGRWRTALPAAVAIECVHAFSLVHDDLPAMDDDAYRRGRLTTHKKFGEALGILAGDALLAHAFEEIGNLAEDGVPTASVVEATRVLARAAGSRELIGGQVLDLAAEGRAVRQPQVREIHERKTGALIRASLEIGGLVGGASSRHLRSLRELGNDLGLAFQIHDDLLDGNSTPASRDGASRKAGAKKSRTGTRVGKGLRPRKDEARAKATYPRAVGEERAGAEAARLYLGCLKRVERLGIDALELGFLILAVAEREE